MWRGNSFGNLIWSGLSLHPPPKVLLHAAGIGLSGVLARGVTSREVVPPRGRVRSGCNCLDRPAFHSGIHMQRGRGGEGIGGGAGAGGAAGQGTASAPVKPAPLQTSSSLGERAWHKGG